MKKILITGEGSYIGNEIKKLLEEFPENYKIETLNMLDDAWRDKHFFEYDVIFHVAGIAHIKETKENTHLYYEVNEHLAVEVAQKAKREGVKHFIILSSMSVYGKITGHIDNETKTKPLTNYGKAKLQADIRIKELETKSFRVAILRPPMVYGKNCKGNYQVLRKFALKSPVFPNFKNKRSMIFVGNLAIFVKHVIDEEKSGLFFPQDAEYVCTASLVNKIAQTNGKKVYFTRVFNWIILIALRLDLNLIKKVFGSLTYEKDSIVSDYDFDTAIEITER